MKQIVTLLLFIFASIVLFGQAPHLMSYQAVVRDNNGQLIRNQNVGIRINILQGSHEGCTVYLETHIITTNDNGLASLEVGAGNTNNDLSQINWADGPYFIKAETDPNGGSNYTITSIHQILSVPYALHANTADALTSEIDEADPVFYAWDRTEGIIISEDQIVDLKPYLTNIHNEHLGDLFDVDIAGVNEGSILKYNADSQTWVVVDIGIKEESDPIFSGSPAAGITIDNISIWDNKQERIRGNEHGEMLFWTGGSWISLPPGSHGQTLSFCYGVPHWGPCPDEPVFDPVYRVYFRGVSFIEFEEIIDDLSMLDFNTFNFKEVSSFDKHPNAINPLVIEAGPESSFAVIAYPEVLYSLDLISVAASPGGPTAGMSFAGNAIIDDLLYRVYIGPPLFSNQITIYVGSW